MKILAVRGDEEGKIIDRMLPHTPDSAGSSSHFSVPLNYCFIWRTPYPEGEPVGYTDGDSGALKDGCW